MEIKIQKTIQVEDFDSKICSRKCKYLDQIVKEIPFSFHFECRLFPIRLHMNMLLEVLRCPECLNAKVIQSEEE